jgi:hypothetical protein
MSTLNKSRRQHTKHQSLARQRKGGNAFLAYITAEATRLAAPARVLRDRLRNLGSLTMAQLTAAADLTAAGVPRMTGNPNVTFALVTAVTPGNVGFGARTTAALTFAPTAAATGNVTFAATGSPGDLTGTITRASGSWTTNGFAVGDYVVVRGTAFNNGSYEITGAVALTLTVTKVFGESSPDNLPDLRAEVVSAATFYNDGVVTRASGSFITDGFAVGDRVVFANTGRSEIEGMEAEITILSATKMSLSVSIPQEIRAHVSGASCTVTSNNVITRASGSFITDGFAVGDVILAGGTTGNVGRAAVVKSVAALRIQTGASLDSPGNVGIAGPVRFAFEAAAGSRTLTGPTTLTRAAGNWTTDGFVAGDRIRVVGAVQAANNRDFRVKVVTSTTVLRLETGNGVAEAASPNVGIYRLNETFGRD